jgi:hypothetical protein
MPETTRLSAARRIAVSPANIFAVLRNPADHVRIDGSGMLIAPHDTAPVSAVGDFFIMDMDGPTRGFPDLGTYLVQVRITRYETNSTIEWTGGVPDQDPIGHVYGYQLTPVGDGATDVVHYYDWTNVNDPWGGLIEFPVITAAGLAKTLDKLAALVEVAIFG